MPESNDGTAFTWTSSEEAFQMDFAHHTPQANSGTSLKQVKSSIEGEFLCSLPFR